MSKRFYITTAIDYLNGQPHLGHAYEKVVTDVIARARRSLGEEVFFLTGLDEHGQKVQQAALKENKTPQAYCDSLAADWKAFTGQLNLTIDDFIRTTEPRHKAVVQAVLAKLHAEDHFYKQRHEGYYSTKEETFLTEKDRLADGTFPTHYGEVIKLTEENWYFKLGVHQQWLIAHIENEQNADFIYPANRRNEVLGFLKNNTLEDLCITRPAARLNWGIPLPFDPAFVTYVWFDALVNYISVPAAHGDANVLAALPNLEIPDPESKSPGGQPPNPKSKIDLWPAAAHVIGKDILKFHAVYWPIMLKAIGLPLPNQILVHGWWQKDGEKIAKSTGNIVEPLKIIEEWGLDAFRYYLVRELDIGPDGNWTDAGFAARYHAELANGLGNLVNRSLSMLKRYRDGIVPTSSEAGPHELSAVAGKAARETETHLRHFRLRAALASIWELVTAANQYVDQKAPFKMAKNPALQQELDLVLYDLVEACRILAVLLWPFTPATSEKIYAQLGLTGPLKFEGARWGGLTAGHVIGEISPLFPRKDQPPR